MRSAIRNVIAKRDDAGGGGGGGGDARGIGNRQPRGNFIGGVDFTGGPGVRGSWGCYDVIR